MALTKEKTAAVVAKFGGNEKEVRRNQKKLSEIRRKTS